MIENFDSSDGMTSSRKNTPLSQRQIFWGFHCNENIFLLEKTDIVGKKWSFLKYNNQFYFIRQKSITVPTLLVSSLRYQASVLGHIQE